MRILNLATAIFLMTLSGTMVAVYHMGYWGDANKAIEYAEITFMYILCVLGLLGLLANLREMLIED